MSRTHEETYRIVTEDHANMPRTRARGLSQDEALATLLRHYRRYPRATYTGRRMRVERERDGQDVTTTLGNQEVAR